MTAVMKHELRGHFHSLTTYLFCAFLLAFVGVGAMLYIINGESVSLIPRSSVISLTESIYSIVLKKE